MAGQTKAGDIGHRMGMRGQQGAAPAHSIAASAPELRPRLAQIRARAGVSSAISAAMMVPMPMGLVRSSTSPGTAPPLPMARAARPVTVKPMVSSAPSEVWPPTISAPAALKTSPAACHDLGQHLAALFRATSGGRVICASATCGAAPIAQTSPSACIAAIRAISAASRVKARRWSVVITCTPAPLPSAPRHHRRGPRSPRRAAALAPRPARRDRSAAPSLAPQPPHSGLSSHRLGQARGGLRGQGLGHRRIVREFRHELAVDAVFPSAKATRRPAAGPICRPPPPLPPVEISLR